MLIHASESAIKKHPDYAAAKSGDADAAGRLVEQTLNIDQVLALAFLAQGRAPTLVSAHAYEASGVNAIPEAMAEALGVLLGWPVDGSVVQINVVSHTGAGGYDRLARQAMFDGEIVAGDGYVLVDDFIGQGGTLANLRGYIESKGGRVLAAVVLTGKPYSAKLALSTQRLEELRVKHGQELEAWWKVRFDHGFDCLTESEARYLANSPDAATIRDRLAQAEQAGDRGAAAQDGIVE